MTIIQFVLIIAILLLFRIYIRVFKNQLFSRILFVLIFMGGIVAVLFPESTNWLAQQVGVGRGADLLTYILVVVFYASFYVLYSKIENIESRQTEIIRQVALQNVKSPTQKP